MTQKLVKIDIEQHKKLLKIRKQNGVPIAEQVRRAVAKWLAEYNEEKS